MAAPWMSLFLVLVVWSVFSFTTSSFVGSDALASPLMLATARIANMALGFVGILSVIAIPIFIIIGIVIFAMGDKQQVSQPMPPQEPPQAPPTQPGL